MNHRPTDLAQAIYIDEAFIDRMHDKAIVRGRERGFILKLHEKDPDAPLSPFYLNLRTPPAGRLSENTVNCASLALLWKTMVAGLDFQYIVGLPQAGEPFALHFPLTRDPLKAEVSLLHLHKKNMPDGSRCICGPVTGGGQRPSVKKCWSLMTS